MTHFVVPWVDRRWPVVGYHGLSVRGFILKLILFIFNGDVFVIQYQMQDFTNKNMETFGIKCSKSWKNCCLEKAFFSNMEYGRKLWNKVKYTPPNQKGEWIVYSEGGINASNVYATQLFIWTLPSVSTRYLFTCDSWIETHLYWQTDYITSDNASLKGHHSL